jgi:hypothetical protein
MTWLMMLNEPLEAQRITEAPALSKSRQIIITDKYSWDWNVIYRDKDNPTILANCRVGPKAYGSAWNNFGFIFTWAKTYNGLALQSTDFGRYNYTGATCSYTGSPETWSGNIANYMWWATASFYHPNNQNGKCYDLIFTHSGPNCNNNINAGLFGTAECTNAGCTTWWGDYYVSGYADGGHEYTGGLTTYAGWGLWGADIPTTNGASYLFIIYNSASNNNDLAIAFHQNLFDTQQRGEEAYFQNSAGGGTGLSACEAVIRPGTGTRWGVGWMGLSVGAGDYVSYFGWYRIWDISYRTAYNGNYGGLFRWTHNGNARWTGFGATHNANDLDVLLTDIHSTSNLCVNQKLVSSENTGTTTDFVLINFNNIPGNTQQWWAKVPRYGAPTPANVGYEQAWDGDSITISQICTTPSPPCQNMPITFTFSGSDVLKVWDLVFNYSCSTGWVIRLTRTGGTLNNVRFAIFRPGLGTYQSRGNAYLLSANANPSASVTVPNPPADGYTAQYGLVVFRDNGNTLGTSGTYQLSASCAGTTPVNLEEKVADLDISVKNGKLVLNVKSEGKVSISIYSINGSKVYSYDGIISQSKEISLKPGVYFYKLNEKNGKLIVK